MIVTIIETYCLCHDIDIVVEENKSNDLQYDPNIKDNVKMYLREISKRPLLTVSEEKELALKVAQGDKFARKIFIESNLKLVVNIAKKYLGKGLDLLDLIQEGNIGLMIAVDKYAVNLGFKFSTFAIWWIRQKIQRAILDKGRNIRLPVHMHEKVNLLNKTQNALSVQLGREPTVSEVASKLKMPIADIQDLYYLRGDTISINTIVTNGSRDDSDTEFEDFIASTYDSPEEISYISFLPEEIQNLFKQCKLSPREIAIISLRYGLIDGEEKTLNEIGIKYGITRERIRQIEEKALKKLRNPKYLKALAEYMDKPDRAMEYVNDLYFYQNISGIKKEGYCTIYEYFDKYPKDLIDKILTMLSRRHREVIKIRFGEDLTVRKIELSWSNKTQRFFNENVVPTINKLLSEYSCIKEERKSDIMADQTIYEYFSEYSKEEIDDAIARLLDNEKELLILRFGKDFNIPITQNNLDESTYTKFYNLITRIRRMLKDPDYTPKRKKNKSLEAEQNMTVLAVPDHKPMVVVPEMAETFNSQQPDMEIRQKNQKLLDKVNIQIAPQNSLKESDKPDFEENQITQEAYLSILQLLKTNNFRQLLSTFTPQEALIASLKLGCINGKMYTTKAIAEFLQLEETEVREITKKVLLIAKDNLNHLIDQAIEIATDQKLALKDMHNQS